MLVVSSFVSCFEKKAFFVSFLSFMGLLLITRVNNYNINIIFTLVIIKYLWLKMNYIARACAKQGSSTHRVCVCTNVCLSVCLTLCLFQLWQALLILDQQY